MMNFLIALLYNLFAFLSLARNYCASLFDKLSLHSDQLFKALSLLATMAMFELALKLCAFFLRSAYSLRTMAMLLAVVLLSMMLLSMMLLSVMLLVVLAVMLLAVVLLAVVLLVVLAMVLLAVVVLV